MQKKTAPTRPSDLEDAASLELPNIDVPLNIETVKEGLAKFAECIESANQQIPEGLHSNTQRLLVAKVKPLLEEARHLEAYAAGCTEQFTRVDLAHSLARLVQQSAKVLTSFLDGSTVFYKKEECLIWPQYALDMYAFLYHGFKQNLYPLLAPVRKHLSLPLRGTISLVNAPTMKTLLRPSDLPEQPDEKESSYVHLEDYSRQTSGAGRVKMPNCVYSTEHGFIPIDYTEQEDNGEWRMPHKTAKPIPTDIWQEERGVFDIIDMRAHDMLLTTGGMSGEVVIDRGEDTEEEPLAQAASVVLAEGGIAAPVEVSETDDGFHDMGELEDLNDEELPTQIGHQRKKIRRRFWVALGVAVALFAANVGLRMANHADESPQKNVPTQVEKAPSDITPTNNVELPISDTTSSKLSAEPEAPLPTGSDKLNPEEPEKPAAEVGNPGGAGGPLIEPDVEPSNVDASVDLTPGPGNWPWNILKHRVSEKHGGEMTPEANQMLSQMTADLLSQAATETEFVDQANIPYNSTHYLGTVQFALETWGGWGDELELIKDCSTFRELLGKMSPNRADYLEQNMAMMRLRAEQLAPIMEMAQNMSFPGEEKVTPEAPPEPSPENPTPPESSSPGAENPNIDGGGSIYDVPEPENLERDQILDPRDPFEPYKHPTTRDPFEPFMKQPVDATEPALPINLLREENPDATPEEFGQILQDFQEGPVEIESFTTKVEPPKFEAVQKRGRIEEVTEKVSKKVRGVFGWARGKMRSMWA